jgi:hypothetical protein
MNQPTWIGRSLNGREGMSAVCKLMAPSRKRVVAIKAPLSYRSTVPDFVQRLEKKLRRSPYSNIRALCRSKTSAGMKMITSFLVTR